MNDHNLVRSWVKESTELDLYRIRRIGLPDVLVYYSEAYDFTEAELALLPSQVKRGSFVLLVPHARVSEEVVEKARAKGVGVGVVGKLMGALTKQNPWEYYTPDERRERA